MPQVSHAIPITIVTWLGAGTFEYEIKVAPGQTRQSADVRIRFK
jgi:hypothetical protein